MQPSSGQAVPRLFSTCPPLGKEDARAHLRHIADVARWSEKGGCAGILVYTDNRLLDPWLVSQIIIQETSSLAPLVAIQPLYMHPYTAAKMVASLGYMYERKLYLNMVAGGFVNDLTALNDTTPHDERYDRLVEYTQIMQALLLGEAPLSFKGAYYQVNNLRLKPPLPSHLFPEVFVSGSSDAGVEAARRTDATAVQYPRPSHVYQAPLAADRSWGIRIGVIARETESEAWSVAHERFPTDRHGRLTHQLAMKVSDSAWHRQLSGLAEVTYEEAESPYWMVPFENYKTFCPYLVGSYGRVAEELGKYMHRGYSVFILDIPREPDDFHHTGIAFDLAKDGSHE